MKFIFWCAFDHLEFRIPEFEALAKLLKIELNWVDKNQTHPWVILDLKSVEEACKLCSRSISTKFCAQLWAQSDNYDKLHLQIRNYLSDNNLKYGPEISFKIHIETIFKKLNIEERLDKIETFSYMNCQGQVKLTNPDVTFTAFEFYGFDQNNLAEEPLNLFFGHLISEGQRDLISKLSLKKRLFIGNTSMDPQLSLLMANLTQVNPSSLVFDPFVGTGSILIACAQFGAQVMGSDIDFLMVHARTKPSRVGQKKRFKSESFRGNFNQYQLNSKLLDVIVADASSNPWTDKLKFDAIVTDPPYGIREPTAKVGTTKAETDIDIPDPQAHIPQKIEYGLGNIFVDLLAFANSHLTLNGRLAFWFPVNREFYSSEMLPCHPCLNLVANCEQILSSHTSRRLLIYEKHLNSAEFTAEQEADCRAKVCQMASKFKENVFKAQELSRAERKERLKKFGHLNLQESSELT